MKQFQQGFSGWVRGGFVALSMVLAASVAGCGGGGGGGDDAPEPPPAVVFEGNWQLSVSEGGNTSGPVTVPASTVPSAADVDRMTTEEVARQVSSSNFQGYTVAIAGKTIRVTGPDTDYTLVINSFEASNYQGCDPCGIGSRVAFDLSVNVTQGGTVDGQQIPTSTESVTLGLRYTRAS